MRSLPSSANLGPKQLAAIAEFANEFEAGGIAAQPYAPQSATVQGILKDMYDTFSADLESQTQTEATAQRDFEDLIATLTKELNVMNEQVLKREEEKAAAAQELAEKMQLLDETKAQMDAE